MNTLHNIAFSSPELWFIVPMWPLLILGWLSLPLMLTAGTVSLIRRPKIAWLPLLAIGLSIWLLTILKDDAYYIFVFQLVPAQLAYASYDLKKFYSDNKKLSFAFKLLFYGFLFSIFLASLTMIFIALQR